MRQLITRIDDDLLARLKDLAAAEKRSVNALVTGILAAEVGGRSARDQLRLRAAGRLVLPPRPSRVPSPASLRDAARGSGAAVGDALMEERGSR